MPTAQISTVIQPVAPHGVFRNEAFIDFSDSKNVHAMQTALTRVGDMLGHEYDLIIGGERSRTAEKSTRRLARNTPKGRCKLRSTHSRPGST
jgi:1-pyrroline-5-carboxylate dehydrogenase